MGIDPTRAKVVGGDAVGPGVTAGAPLDGTGVGEASADGAGLVLVASGRGDGEVTSAAQPTTESESHRSARARDMGPTLYDAQSGVIAAQVTAGILPLWLGSDDANSSHTSGTPGQIFKDLPVITSERKTGLYVRDVETVRLVRDGRGWLRLAADPSLRVEYCAAWRPRTQDGESADRAAAVR
jgi:hypothetical protein